MNFVVTSEMEGDGAMTRNELYPVAVSGRREDEAGFHSTKAWPGEEEKARGYKYSPDRAADGWVGSGCLRGRCAKWDWHMLREVSDPLDSQKTLLNAWKSRWRC